MKTLALAILLEATLATAAPPPCPGAVTTAIEKKFPKSTVQVCKAEREDGHDQFEVKLTKADGGKVEVDLSPAGAILQTEEVVALDQVPAAVMKAFAAKYPKAKPNRAEKQTPATGKPSYELAFQVDGKRKEATFAEDGAFMEEE
ncbi:MAG: PepSY-like domain-containing protein [Deltaproteobacteria bacterium]